MALPRIPRILLVVPGLAAGLLIPALASPPKHLPAGAVGMIGNDFTRSVVTIHEGQRLTLFNNSTVVHVIGPGWDGRIIGTAPHVPAIGFHLMQTDAVYKTGVWKTPGTYRLTCSVHPDMNLKVIVTR
jgi:hypothetical protein